MPSLHAGCGLNRMIGWLNADQFTTPATDVVYDLEQPWPFPDNQFTQVYSSHVVEHLDNWQMFFQEAWRVLEPGGRLTIRVPYGGHASAWWDFGHKRPYYTENFVMFQPGYARQIGNLEHEGWHWPYSIELLQVRISGQIVKVLRWLPRRVRQLVLEWIRHSADACQELFVTMTPLKSPDAVEVWLLAHHPTTYPLQYICFAHQWTGKVPQEGEALGLHTLASGVSVGCYV